MLGTAIALGATTAYYKLEADDLYEEYKITGDPGLVDNIEHYDDQSAWNINSYGNLSLEYLFTSSSPNNSNCFNKLEKHF